MKKVPEEYLQPAEKQGTIARADYDTVHYAGILEPLKKHVSVYLPYGYDENDREKKYNVFYYLHGFGGNAESEIGTNEAPTPLKNMLDHMIESGEMEPAIFVFPTFSPKNRMMSFQKSLGEIESFADELMDDIICAVESKFNTYLEEPTEEAAVASAKHRGFGGYSLGAVAAWNVFLFALDRVRNFFMLSGDCWTYEIHGGLTQPMATAIATTIPVANNRLAPDDFYIQVYTGTLDTVYKDTTQQVEYMKQYFGQIFTDDNVILKVEEGGTHSPESFTQYLYNGLPDLFK
ncbi:MAG: hypothetical protein E7240_01680 [Lachnospiraceae bacterium]|nr:hypothetical protein [Lachnospiraceae bacterium]